MARPMPVTLAILLVCAPALAADPPKVVLVAEAQDLPTASGAALAEDPHASGGEALRLAAPDARLGMQIPLPAGEYTLVVSVTAADPHHDAIYVSAPGVEQRLAVGGFGELVTLSVPFIVTGHGPSIIVIRPDPDELGVLVDQVAIVRGSAGQGVAPAEMEEAVQRPELSPLPGPEVASTAPAEPQTPTEFELSELPDGPHARGLDTLLLASFDESADADWARGRAGCANLSRAPLAEGHWGRALDCTGEQVRVLYNMERNIVSRAGTMQCWVRAGETNIWADGLERYLLHLRTRRPLPGEPRVPVTLEVVKREDDALHLSAAGTPLPIDLAVPTADLDPAAWHHVAVSWDCRDRDSLRFWLTVDGRGETVGVPWQTRMMPFSIMQVGNAPWVGHYAHEGEHAELGGYIDDLHISDETPPMRASRPDGLGEIDLDLALAAEDALAQWLEVWAELQTGGAWGPWITPMINANSGIYFDWTGQADDRRLVRNKYGSSIVSVAYDYADTFEHTGDERWRQIAWNAVDFFLRGQDPRGYWYESYIVDESGRIAGMSTQWARVQDGHQSQPFLFLLNWHRITGDRRAFEADRKCADFLLSIENPNGSWPGTYNTATGTGRTTGPRGVELGCEYNDHATTDPMRMMMTMYHLTGDEKYIRGREGSRGILGIGQWMFDTQIGEGEVRGWCQQYDQDNNPVWSRDFEAPVISPRVVNRFIHPQTVTLYLMTGDERYMRLLQETYDWYRSVEVPGEDGGWYYQYLPDGTPVYSTGFETIKIDPENPPPGAPAPGRDKIQLTAIQRDLEAYQELGPEGFRESFVGSVEFTDEDYADRQQAAVAWLQSHQDAVREEVDQLQREGVFTSGHRLRPPHEVQLHRWVLETRVARGVAPRSVFSRGGRSPWVIGGRGWKRPVAYIEDWFDVPLDDTGAQ
ncbi:MAG: pectate lyase [Armatimonadota bacterium]